MSDYTCNAMNSSTRIGKSGARPHIDRPILPVNSEMLMFILRKVNKI